MARTAASLNGPKAKAKANPKSHANKSRGAARGAAAGACNRAPAHGTARGAGRGAALEESHGAKRKHDAVSEPKVKKRPESARPHLNSALARGHYDALQLPPAATAINIRDHFRRLVMQVHPDEGGNIEAFKAVTAAFEVLSDGMRRAEYDRQRIATGSKDGVGQRVPGSREAVEPEESEIRRTAREVIMTLVDEPVEVQQQALQNCTPDELDIASQFLQPAYKLLERQQESKGGADKQLGGQDVAVGGIYCFNRGGYEVNMSWKNLKLRTSKTHSLAEVMDWYITLTQLKAAALQRLAADRSTAEEIPLTEEELALGYQASPTMRLVMASIVGSGNSRTASPTTPSLALCMQHLHMFQSCYRERPDQACRDKAKKAAWQAELRKLKEESSKQAQQEKLRRDSAEVALLSAITRTLQGFGCGSRSRPAVNVETLPVDQEDETSVAMEMCKLLSIDIRDPSKVADTVRSLGDDDLAAARSVILGETLNRKILKDA